MILPNFIPMNEAVTKPDVLHAVYTPSEPRMKKRLSDLTEVAKTVFPKLTIEKVPISDAYNSKEIYEQCKKLVEDDPNDEWSLNATGGTKMMSSPADEFFRERSLPVYYIDTSKSCILKIAKDWSSESFPFENTIDVETYFALHGHKIRVNKPRTQQERHIFNQLKMLDWKVWASVNWLRPDNEKMNIAEYDIIGIKNYRMSVFECKRLNINHASVARGEASGEDLKRVENDILNDLHKLSQAQKSFGGPFGKTFWIFDGRTRINRTNRERIKEFGITLIEGDEINQLIPNAKDFGLPQKKKQKV